jgi:hypothetical protein
MQRKRETGAAASLGAWLPSVRQVVGVSVAGGVPGDVRGTVAQGGAGGQADAGLITTLFRCVEREIRVNWATRAIK